MTRIATKSRVSPKTLRQLLGEEVEEARNPPNGVEWKGEIAKWQKRVGLGKALVRLVHFAFQDLAIKDQDLRGTVELYAEAFGIPRDDQYLRSSVRSALRELARPAETDDLTSQHIRDSGEVALGLLQWDPYCPEDEESDKCFAGRFLKAMFRSVFPWEVEIGLSNLYKQIEPAIDDLLTWPPKLHALFALYKTPARMGEGLTFIEIPGVRGYLGLLFSNTEPTRKLAEQSSATVWNVIFGLPTKKTIAALTIEREVGESFLRGVASTHDSMIVDSATATTLEELAEDFRKYAPRNDDKDAVVFVAEWGLCERLMRQLNDSTGSGYRTLDYDRDKTPWYPTGVAIRSDASMLVQRLQFAVMHELFDIARERTAHWYGELVARYLRHVAPHLLDSDPQKLPPVAPVLDFRDAAPSIPALRDPGAVRKFMDRIKDRYWQVVRPRVLEQLTEKGRLEHLTEEKCSEYVDELLNEAFRKLVPEGDSQ